MTIAIIGAKGDMGKFLASFLSPLGAIQLVDKQSSLDEWRKTWEADVIWLSIPRDAIDLLLKNRALKENQLMVDICSIKRNLSEVIQKTGVAHLSLHPLHGPYIPLDGQRWAVIPTQKRVLNHPQAKIILGFLKKQGVNFFQAKSEEYHDFMLGITLSMPELITVIIENLIEQYIKDNNFKKPTDNELIKWSAPATNAMFGACRHTINSSSYWLRLDLLGKANPSLIRTARKTFEKLANLSEDSIRQRFKKQNIDINKLSFAERERIKFWIERWFSDSTKMLFSEKKKSTTKPAVVIQYRDKIDKVFPSSDKKIKIGIHGIKGCFTHESILRFCEETKFNVANLGFKFLITAENVLKSLSDGIIDRGVFAIANSGSGAYISSVHQIGKYSFDVLAIYGMEIIQCLLMQNSSDENSIKEVFGHPQAVSQCKRTLATKYPYLKLVYGKDEDDTALCAKKIASGKLPKTTATLASQIAAKLYGLKILSYNMHHDPFNTTTFLIVERKGS